MQQNLSESNCAFNKISNIVWRRSQHRPSLESKKQQEGDFHSRFLINCFKKMSIKYFDSSVYPHGILWWNVASSPRTQSFQWQIQDFPEEGALTPKGGRQPIIWPIFLENCIKINKFWAGGARPLRPLDPPLCFVNQLDWTWFNLNERQVARGGSRTPPERGRQSLGGGCAYPVF